MAKTPEELAAITDETAANPAQLKVGQEEAGAQPVRDLLALEKQRAANAQVTAAGIRGMLNTIISPPGAA